MVIVVGNRHGDTSSNPRILYLGQGSSIETWKKTVIPLEGIQRRGTKITKQLQLEGETGKIGINYFTKKKKES